MMNATKFIAIALLSASLISLVYAGFTYPKNRDDKATESVHSRMMKEEHINIPLALGLGCLLLGSLLFVLRNKL